MQTVALPSPALQTASWALGLGFPKPFPPLRRSSTPQHNGPTISSKLASPLC